MKKKLLLLILLTSLYSFAQENTNLIGFSTDTYFDYKYENNTADIEDWNEFYNENKTTNPKPTILVDPIIEDDYYDRGIIYDNENNAYSVSYIDVNEDFLYSIKEYSVENNSWLEIVNDTVTYDIGGAFFKAIYKNSNGEHFIEFEGVFLGDFTYVSIFQIKNNLFESIYNVSTNYSLESLYYSNDHFYKISSGGVVYEDIDGETIEITTVFIQKSTDTTTLSIKDSYLTETNPIIKFKNGKITCKDYSITYVLTINGQSIPNENLEKNVIYIVTINNANGVKYSAKILAQ